MASTSSISGPTWPTAARCCTARRSGRATHTEAPSREKPGIDSSTTAEREIGILVYSGLFLAEDLEALGILAERARAGVRSAFCSATRAAQRVAERGVEEGIAEAMPAKVRNAIVQYRPLLGVDGFEIRLHATVLYNSLYRADDELMVNTHIHGIPAAHAPVLHLHAKDESDLVATYLDSFERVWDSATPHGGWRQGPP